MKTREVKAMKVGLLFKLVKLTRAIRIFFGKYTAMEEKHELFRLPKLLTPQEIYRKLIPECYQYNTLSTTFKRQIFTARKLTDLSHQIHLRFYSDGWVSGHYELQPDMFSALHLKGVDLRALTPEEREEIRSILTS
ncbi:hypothetical protein ES703_121032 [subsurface metagenome]